MPNKKKIIFHSNFSKNKSGFGRNSLAVLSYLWRTGKYDIVEYATAPLTWSDQRCGETPWKCYGALPDDQSSLSHLSNNFLLRQVGYGAGNIDKLIAQEKPDVYIGAEDIWAFQGYWNKEWWGKIPTVLWTTLDSLPVLPTAIEAAKNTENFWVWASFAEKALKAEGIDHVKTVHGAVGSDFFHPLSEGERDKFRKASGIGGELVFGFVFRNQLRKLVGSLIEGFANYLKSGGNGKLLLHTQWTDPGGWDIVRFLKEFNVPFEKVLTTYVCSNCGAFTVRPFTGENIGCPSCKSPNTLVTPRPSVGVSEVQMNIIYNLMDAYVHPMTSGGLEMPIIEAMMAGLPVATVGYSCGEDYTHNSFVYNLSYNTYREVHSNFIKAQVNVDSITNFMQRVDSKRDTFKKKGEKGRKWAIEAFSDEKAGKFIEEFIDSLPENDYVFVNEPEKRNDNYPMPEIENEVEWILDLYKNILKMSEAPESKGVRDWLEALEKGVERRKVYEYFIEKAKEENKELFPPKLEEFISNSDDPKICYMIPNNAEDCYASLHVLDGIRNLYPSHEVYVCTQESNFAIFEPFGFKLIPYSDNLDNPHIWEGVGDKKGFVDIFFPAHFVTQKFPCYSHNGLDINELQKL